jgi:DNA-binding NarL/FixJ family response regulator
MASYPDPLRVLVIANDPLARAGLATLLTDQPTLVVVGRIPASLDLLAEVDIYHPDVLVFDLGWDPGLPPATRPYLEQAPTSLNTLTELRELGLPIVALLPDETYAAEAWAAGAHGLLLRQTSPEKLVAALQGVIQGLHIFDSAFTQSTFPTRSLETPTLTEPLTPRELEVLQLLAEGLPNKVIARQLDISDHTVKFHVNAILSKLSAQSRTEAVVRATRLGLILL